MENKTIYASHVDLLGGRKFVQLSMYAIRIGPGYDRSKYNHVVVAMNQIIGIKPVFIGVVGIENFDSETNYFEKRQEIQLNPDGLYPKGKSDSKPKFNRNVVKLQELGKKEDVHIKLGDDALPELLQLRAEIFQYRQNLE